MLLERKYFRLNSELSLPDVKFGDSIDKLVNEGIINKINKDDGIEFRYVKNDNIVIGEIEGKVNMFFFTKESGCSFLNFDPYSFPYPATEPITDYLSKKFELLSNIRTMKELKSEPEGIYMILIFSDFIPRHLFLIKH